MKVKRTAEDLRKLREKNRVRMKKKREEIKLNPQLHAEMKKAERLRYHKRVNEGKIKLAKDLSEREIRKVRKTWKKKAQRLRKQRKEPLRLGEQIMAYSPPRTPPLASPNPESHQKRSGKKRSRRCREIKDMKIKELELKLEKMKASRDKYKMRCHRIDKKGHGEPSPRKVVDQMLPLADRNKKAKRELLFNEALKAQIATNYTKTLSYKKKKSFLELLSGKIIEKYHFRSFLGRIAPSVLRKKKLQEDQMAKTKSKNLREKIRMFLERDEFSTQCAGKKEFKSLKGEKKQRRVLNDTLLTLFKKFKLLHPNVKVCYATFCKLKPFWIVPHDFGKKTCLCITHENMNLVISKLHQHKVIAQRSTYDVINAIICSEQNKSSPCLARTCSNCKHKSIDIEEFNGSSEIVYHYWGTKTVPIVSKGKEKLCKKTVKEEKVCTLLELVNIFFALWPTFVGHVRKMEHQRAAIDRIKAELTSDSAIVHMDFSENYTSAYTREVQSAHFGGSKEQISLHTVVIYYRTDSNGSLLHKSFATISDNVRHDPAAICAHLRPIIDFLLGLSSISCVHFVSDGPTTQYRNRKMFSLVGKYLGPSLKAHKIQWHYTEAGHGKGAPDGIGGTIKRTADRMVALGKGEIINADSLLQVVQDNTEAVRMHKIEANMIEDMDKLFIDIKPFTGTLKVHNLSWDKKQPDVLRARALSCTQCENPVQCKHFFLGQISLMVKPLKVQDVYTDSENEDGHRGILEPHLIEEVGVGDWIIVSYNKSYYAGKVLEKDSEGVQVTCLEKGRKFLKWPIKKDTSFYYWSEIVKKIKEPEQLKRGFLSVPELSGFIE